MRIRVAVVPNAKTPEILKVGEGEYRVRVNARATEGRANERLIELLAGHFGIPKSRVRIIRGVRGRNKVVEVAV